MFTASVAAAMGVLYKEAHGTGVGWWQMAWPSWSASVLVFKMSVVVRIWSVVMVVQVAAATAAAVATKTAIAAWPVSI